MHFLNLSSCCLWLLQDWTFVFHVLLQILQGSSSFASAVEPASLPSFCADILLCLLSHLLCEPPIWSLNSLLLPSAVWHCQWYLPLNAVSLFLVGLCLALFCRVDVWWSSSWFCPVLPVMVMEDKKGQEGWGRRCLPVCRGNCFWTQHCCSFSLVCVNTSSVKPQPPHTEPYVISWGLEGETAFSKMV